MRKSVDVPNPLLGDLGGLLISSCYSDGRPSTASSFGGVPHTAGDPVFRRYRETLLQNSIQWPLEGETREGTVLSALATHSQQELSHLVVSLIDIVEDLAKKNEDERFSICGDMRFEADRGSVMSIMRPPVCETSELKLDVDKHGRKLVNRYMIISELGRGAFGSVYFAKDRDTNTNVAIKIVSKKRLKTPKNSSDGVSHSEIAVMKKLRHRNCVSLLEVIDAPGSANLFLVMEYMRFGPVVSVRQFHEGVSSDLFQNSYLLKSVTRDGEYIACRPLPESICAQYLRQLVSGLRYLHGHGVIHHDIKPDNILCGDDGRICFSDFGVSEVVNCFENTSTKALNKVRSGAATPLFSAPEEFEGLKKDGRDVFMTDVWALGVTLFLMLVGVAPFNGATYFAVAKDVQEAMFPWNCYNLMNDKLCHHWKTILDGMLAKKPKERWTLERLKEFLDDKMMALENPLSPTAGKGKSPQNPLLLKEKYANVDAFDCTKDSEEFVPLSDVSKLSSFCGTILSKNTRSTCACSFELSREIKPMSSTGCFSSEEINTESSVRHSLISPKRSFFQRTFNRILLCRKKSTKK